MEAGKAIYHLLDNSTAIGAICGNRIYPEIAQQTEVMPFIIYTVQSANPSPTKGTTSTVDAVQIETQSFSKDYGEAMDMGTAVRAALDRVGGVINGVQVQSIDFKTQAVDYDFNTDAYILVQTFDMRLSFTGTAATINPIAVVQTYDAIQVKLSDQQKPEGSDTFYVQGTSPTRLPFSVQDIKTNSLFEFPFNSTLGLIRITGTGIYKFTAVVTFRSDQNNVQPAIYFKVESRTLEATGTTYIKGGTNNDRSTAVITQICEITNSERCSVLAYESTNSTGGVAIQNAIFLIERMSST
jgi:hypothetical protein